ALFFGIFRVALLFICQGSLPLILSGNSYNLTHFRFFVNNFFDFFLSDVFIEAALSERFLTILNVLKFVNHKFYFFVTIRYYSQPT
ncbi:MAG: hypothetical protein LUE16_03885, partial [Lachnospiraceae bacterium]|nr:hypothetical protein [Lachnospiraceae bacterium]